MAQSGAIWVDKMCYGIGQVDYAGAFTVNANVATVAHGKGFTVVWSNANGYFTVKLNTAFKGMIDGGASLNAPATQGNAYTHPGFAVVGDLQSDGQSFAIYTYQFAGTQLNPTSNTFIEFAITVSNSLTNP